MEYLLGNHLFLLVVFVCHLGEDNKPEARRQCMEDKTENLDQTGKMGF